MRTEVIGDATLYLGDCREVLPTLGRVDAVCTDPPYGIGEAAGKNASRSNLAPAKDYGRATWDDAPIDHALLTMVLQAGRWQILFGGNYYALPPSSCWLVWDKMNTGDFADCELAWTNLQKAVRRIRYMWNGMLRANNEQRGDHPTQKPIGVMSWVLQQLPGDVRTVLDPFMGSATTGVACVRMGLSFIGIERDPAHYETALRRIEAEYRRPRLPLGEPVPQPKQEALL
jgi:DNA modification methylase